MLGEPEIRLQKLNEQFPSLKIIVMSGYDDFV